MGIHRLTLYQRQNVPLVQLQNQFYCGNLDTDYDDAIVTLAFLLDNWATNLAPVLDINWELYETGVQEVSTAGFPELRAAVTPPIEGEVAGGPVATQSAVYVALRSNTAKPNRSPKWLGVIPKARIVNGVWDSTLMTAVTAFMTDMIGWNEGVATAEQRICCAHFDPTFNRVTQANVADSYYLTNIPKSMRRRTYGYGS